MINKIFSIRVDRRAWPAASLFLVISFFCSAFFSLASFFCSAFFSLEMGLIGFLVLSLHLAFFRDPNISVPPGEFPVSPANGKVVEVSTEMEPRFLHEESIKIKIFLSILDVHINRAPIAGHVEYLDYVPGKFFSALSKNSNLYNESNWIGLQNKDRRLLVRQIAGAIARRIRCDVAMNQELQRGQKLGIICYGSGMEIFIPKRFFRPSVKVGDRLKAGESLLGVWT